MASALEKLIQGTVVVAACFAGTRLLTSYDMPVQREQTSVENTKEKEYQQELEETPAEKEKRKKIEDIEKRLTPKVEKNDYKVTPEIEESIRNKVEKTRHFYKPVCESMVLFDNYIETEQVYAKFVLATRKYIENTLHDVDISNTEVNKELDVMNKYVDRFVDEHKKAVDSILEMQKAIIKIKDVKTSDAADYGVELSDKAIEVAGLIEKASKTDLEYMNSFMIYMQKAPDLNMIKVISPILSNFITQRNKMIEGCSYIKESLNNHKKDCMEFNSQNSLRKDRGNYYGGV